jgi:phosphoribosylglycinamide formyltransferase-1
MIKIAIFASGGGSNARKISAYFEGRADIGVTLVVSDRADAGVLSLSGVTCIVMKGWDALSEALKDRGIDVIVLAGFLKKVPERLIQAFPGRIINIHPSLLPKYGGKGMYGMHVHEAVKKNGDTISGMTIHLVNERYDEGEILFQARCPIDTADTAKDIAAKVLTLEHRHFAPVLEQYLRQEPIIGATEHS